METKNTVSLQASIDGLTKEEQEKYFTSEGSKIVPLVPNYPTIAGFSACEVTYRLTAKQEKEGKVKQQSKLCYYPVIALAEEMQESYAKIILAALDSQAAAVVKALVDTSSNVVLWDMLAHDVLLESLLAEQESQRLNGEKIGLWFDNSPTVAKFIEQRATEKQGAAPNVAFETLRAGTATTWRKEFCKLAAPNPGIVESAANKLLSLLALCSGGDSIVAAMTVKVKGHLIRLAEVDSL